MEIRNKIEEIVEDILLFGKNEKDKAKIISDYKVFDSFMLSELTNATLEILIEELEGDKNV